jgi:hypothetical protein
VALYAYYKCLTEYAASGNVGWDELGSEALEHGRIWYIYNDESTKMDAATTDGLNRGIDVLLVFVSCYVFLGCSCIAKLKMNGWSRPVYFQRC